MFKKLKVLYRKFLRDSSFGRTEKSEIILVYQMGKVGSTSLEKSIPGAKHLHTLYDNHPCQVKQKIYSPFAAKRKLRYWLHRRSINNNKVIKIISLVREPVSRSISMYFQELCFYLVNYASKTRLDTRTSSANLLLDAYINGFDHQYFEHWFDKELFRFTGVDIFASSFDPALGWKRFRRGKFDILLLKVEKLQDVLPVISEFVGHDVELCRVNDAADKWYFSLYESFKRDIDIVRMHPCNREILAGRTAEYFGYS